MFTKEKIKIILIALYALRIKSPKGPLDTGYNRGINDAIEAVRHYFPDIKMNSRD